MKIIFTWTHTTRDLDGSEIDPDSEPLLMNIEDTDEEILAALWFYACAIEHKRPVLSSILKMDIQARNQTQAEDLEQVEQESGEEFFDPVVLYDPIAGPITDLQFREICKLTPGFSRG
jgi:hypothetical protein